jgi:hypothetical protein
MTRYGNILRLEHPPRNAIALSLPDEKLPGDAYPLAGLTLPESRIHLAVHDNNAN